MLTNLHRGRATLSPPPDPATGRPQEAYALALRALAMQLPGAMGEWSRAAGAAAGAGCNCGCGWGCGCGGVSWGELADAVPGQQTIGARTRINV